MGSQSIWPLIFAAVLIVIFLATPAWAIYQERGRPTLARGPFIERIAPIALVMVLLSLSAPRMTAVAYAMLAINLWLFFVLCRVTVQRLKDAELHVGWAMVLLIVPLGLGLLIVLAFLPTRAPLKRPDAAHTSAIRATRPPPPPSDAMTLSPDERLRLYATFMHEHPVARWIITCLAAPMFGIFAAIWFTTDIIVYKDELTRHLTSQSYNNLAILTIIATFTVGLPLMIMLVMPVLMSMRRRGLIKFRYALVAGAVVGFVAKWYLNAVFGLSFGEGWLTVMVASIATMTAGYLLYFMDMDFGVTVTGKRP